MKTESPQIKALCTTGLRLRHAWTNKLNRLAHLMHGDYDKKLDDQWQQQWGKGHQSFSRHVSRCLTCKAYLISRITK